MSGRPLYEPTDDDLRRMNESDDREEHDDVQVFADGREVVETGYDDDAKRHRYHEVDQRGNVLWDKPVAPEDVERAAELVGRRRVLGQAQ